VGAGGFNVIVALADLLLSAALVAVTVTDCVLVTVAGALYRPLDEMLPTAGEIDQFTAVLVVLVTAALNCCVAPCARLADNGLTEMATGFVTTGGVKETVADADVAGLALLVAVTVTFCAAVRLAGAV
jgi:hypothetical protein